MNAAWTALKDTDEAGDARPERNASQASKPVTVHALGVTDYTLAPLDFGAPAVHEFTLLRAASYTLGPLAFSVPRWRYGYVRVTWVDAGSDVDLGGRPLKISEDAETRMTAAVESWLTDRRITDLKRVSLTHRAALKKYVRALAKAEDVSAADSTLHRRVIKPAVTNVADRAANKT